MKPKRKLVKSVTLTPEQIREIKTDLQRPQYTAKLLADMVARLATVEADLEGEAWDSVAQVAGFKDSDDLHAQGMTVRVDLICSEIHVYEEEDPDAS